MADQGSLVPPLGKLIVGNENQILLVNFNGAEFSIAARCIIPKWLPSSILFKEPNLLYAVNEIGMETSMLRLVPNTPANGPPVAPDAIGFDKLSFVNNAQGSLGGNHIAFNADKTRIVETCYSSGRIDVWDISGESNLPVLKKSIRTRTENGYQWPRQRRPGPRQAILDPTGRFFIISNPGTSSLHVMDTLNDRYEITGITAVPNTISPESMACITHGGTHYLVVAGGLSTAIALMKMEYTDAIIRFTTVHWGHAGRRWDRGEIIMSAFTGLEVAKNQRDVYLWNRFPGENSGHIAHFRLTEDGGVVGLTYVHNIPTRDIQPRMVSLSGDDNQEFVFVANEYGESGLVAFRRDPTTGRLDPNPAATFPNELLAPYGASPHVLRGVQFVREL
ncbi:putative isomerase YbhE [Daldinia loculata]|uniref:putative isomerase YbhE n=1 Tax=Daldinia loculata TaxID=103429 RepID=UPI0020C29BBA|nr:putative isomerase YbhE [Daldinia loculata]KAI1648927.1 putative isomerase YbhE [Daldinia loculata]